MGTTLAQKRRWDAFNAQKHPLSFSAIPYSSEFPQHPVTLTKAFYMGAYEVTRGQWFAVLDSSRQVRRPRRAMSNVSWLEVLHFIAALNELSGRTFRLPTEAEWEYAARAGTETLWFSGDDPKKALLELRQKNPNPWGLYKVIGGVFELTSHGLRRYEDRPEVDPVGPQPQDAAWDGKVMIRGGDNGIWGQDWPTLPHYARSAYRVRWAADRPFMSIGFRLLMEDDAPTAVREAQSWGAVKKTARD